VKRSRSRGLLVIAVFRLAKAAALVVAALGTLKLLDRSTAAQFNEWLSAIPFVESHARLQEAAAKIATAQPRHLEIVASVALAYAALFAVEGIGLWKQRVWAEYLTIVATTSFIPFEVYEITRRFTLIRLAVLLANAAIVAYLVVRRIRAHRAR
jgi:uncharacterized membrane protein (DUF2068 family)